MATSSELLGLCSKEYVVQVIQLILLDMSTDMVKMSKIMEHNPHGHTDQLYDPLRKAINKSSVPNNCPSRQSSRSSLTPDKLQSSHITHNIKHLTMSDAQNIKKRTFIPADRELIPTHHVQRIAGKHFYAVDVEERYGAPLTTSQFDREPKKNYQQILYEYKDARGNSVMFPNYQGQIYQSYAQDKAGEGYISNTRSNLMAVPVQRPFAKEKDKTATYRPFSQLQSKGFIQQKGNMSIPFTQQKTLMSQPFQYEKVSASSPGYPQDNNFYQENTYMSQPSTESWKMNQTAPYEGYSANYSQFTPVQSTNINNRVSSNNPPFLSTELPSKTRDKKTRSKVPQQSRSMSQFGGSGVKSYKFDKKLISGREANRSELQARKKGDYKYNLFSMLDETGNKGCKSGGGVGCWVDNELVAQRRNKTQWNQ